MENETKSRFPSVAVSILVVVIGIGLLAYWGVRTVISAIPTPDEVAAVFEPEPYEEIGPVTITAMRDLAQMTTVETVQYTIVEKGTDAGWLSWARGDSLRMFAVARIGAGVDLSRLSDRDVWVDDAGVFDRTLPTAEIQFVEPDHDATQVLERDLGLFTKGDPRLESEVRRLADEVLLENAIEEGILARAERNARSVLTDFLVSLGYTDVVIEFTDQVRPTS